MIFFIKGCYTIKQGFYQIKLFSKSQKIYEVIQTQKESPDRLEKLNWVPKIILYAKNNLGLETGNSYTTYISLKKNEPVVYIVQAAHQRELKLKTWWFPIIGIQPYLGFFRKEDALDFKNSLEKSGYETSWGGVQAFSMLGYLPDPLYSSLLDGNSIPELAEIIFHECAHQTLYIPNEYVFNENFADFFAKRATLEFLSHFPELNEKKNVYINTVKKEIIAQNVFQNYLSEVKNMLIEFYSKIDKEGNILSQKDFIDKRYLLFQDIEKMYLEKHQNAILGTSYENRFNKNSFNNAVFLGYEVYESNQKPFEDSFNKYGNNFQNFISDLKSCFKEVGHQKNKDVWFILKNCKKG